MTTPTAGVSCVLGESVERFDTRLYLFCLMGNHIHLVVETPRANLGQFMHRIETAYTVYFNRRHEHCGHLLQGRYGARLVEKDAYLLRLSRYVHLNPVFTTAARKRPVRERIAMLREYRWSSYRSYIGGSAGWRSWTTAPSWRRLLRGRPGVPGLPPIRRVRRRRGR